MTPRPRRRLRFAVAVIAALVGVVGALQAADAKHDGAAVIQSPPADQWPISRGNPQLQGVAAGTIPDSPELLWSFKTEGPVKSSAVIGNGKAYIGSDDGSVYCLDLKTGAKLWAFKTKDSVEAPPTLAGDNLYVGSVDSFLYCLDANSGAEKWKYEAEDKFTAAPNLAKLSDGREIVVIGSHDMSLHAVDAKTGKGVWKYETENFINAASAIEEGVAIFGGCDGLLHVVQIADGKQDKEVEISGYVAGSAALLGSSAYLGDMGNEFVAVDLKAGNVLWSFKEKNFPFYASPAVTMDRVVFGGRDKRVHCVSRTETLQVKGIAPPAIEGQPAPEAPILTIPRTLWSFPTRGKVDSSPVVIDGKVVVGSDDGRLYILSLADGKKLWDYEIGQPIGSSPAIAAGIIVVGSEDGSVYAFGAKGPGPRAEGQGTDTLPIGPRP